MLPLDYLLTYLLIKSICGISDENEIFNHIGYKFMRHRANNSNETCSDRCIESQVQIWNMSFKTCYKRHSKNNNQLVINL